jgi:murein DD-endopeptidase MepM/ murein hydrolase activator NlpD
MNLSLPILLTALALAIAAPRPAQAAPPSLDLPIACTIGQTCEVQSYMDDDPGPGAKDYRCGTRAYEKHGGIDIRIPSLAAMNAGVPVLASAAGKVLRLRDGVPDLSVRGRPPGPIDSQECGNGVVIGHGDGWETQYCHMRRGSVRVKIGDTVRAGDPIGLVGLSGNTEFPHIHITVRQGTTTVDPFAYGAAPGSCGGGTSLWSTGAAAALVYKPRIVFNAGFTASADNVLQQVDNGAPPAPNRRSPVLIAYSRAIGLKAGDVQQMLLTAPGGRVLAQTQSKPLPGNQAQTLLYIGGRAPAAGWAPGVYQATYRVLHDGKPVLERRFSVTL